MSNISVHALDVFVAAPGDAFIPPSARLRCSWRLTSYGEFPPDGDGEEGGRREREHSHDSEWVRVIFSCPFITFIKVWGEDTCKLFDLFCQSLQWWDSQLRSLVQSESSVSSKICRRGAACSRIHDWSVFNVSDETPTECNRLNDNQRWFADFSLLCCSWRWKPQNIVQI